MEDPHIIAIDFEAAGGVTPKHGMTEMGAALINMVTGGVVATFNMYANMKGYEWEERSLREFWLKNEESMMLYKQTLEETEKSSHSPYDVVDHFFRWLDEVSKGIKTVHIVSDNSQFDVAILRFFSRNRDISYAFGEYRTIIDTHTAYLGYSGLTAHEFLDGSSKKLVLRGLKNRLEMYRLAGYKTDHIQIPDTMPNFHPHDHHPVNDAISIGLKWVFVQKLVAQLNELHQ